MGTNFLAKYDSFAYDALQPDQLGMQQLPAVLQLPLGLAMPEGESCVNVSVAVLEADALI